MAAADPKRYFAYSTLLDPEERASWMAKNGYPDFQLPAGRVAQALDVDLVFNFHSPIWGGRVCGLTRKPGASVFGVLFEIPSAQWPTIQHAEGAKAGKFIEIPVEVRLDGKQLGAIAFSTRLDRITTVGPVSEAFLTVLARGAMKCGLPADYVTRLRAEAAIVERVQRFGKQMGLK